MIINLISEMKLFYLQKENNICVYWSDKKSFAFIGMD